MLMTVNKVKVLSVTKDPKLVSPVVKFHCTNIPNAEGTVAIRQTSTWEIQIQKLATKVLQTFLCINSYA